MDEDLFQDLVESAQEMAAIERGDVAPARITVVEIPDVKAIRRRLNATQQQFAQALGISVATLRNWEQGRRNPDGPARALLQVAAKHPEVVLDTLILDPHATREESTLAHKQ